MKEIKKDHGAWDEKAELSNMAQAAQGAESTSRRHPPSGQQHTLGECFPKLRHMPKLEGRSSQSDIV